MFEERSLIDGGWRMKGGGGRRPQVLESVLGTTGEVG